ncbi:19797_t:CDS:1, partial [Dentiscutata erythropus]
GFRSLTPSQEPRGFHASTLAGKVKTIQLLGGLSLKSRIVRKPLYRVEEVKYQGF